MRILTALFFAAFASVAQAEPTETLHDILSPDEVAEELGLEIPSEEFPLVQFQKSQVTFASQAWDVLNHYRLVVVVNKATVGPTAQKAFIYVDGMLMREVKVSTGREKQETSKSGKKYFSATPVGWFNPTWQSKNHFSNTWQAPMPFSTFFNGGIAIHAALPAYFNQLGSRASGGCVRMLPADAEYVFNLARDFGKGQVPAFTRHGGLKRDKNGNLQFTQGWKTLIIVEDRPNR